MPDATDLQNHEAKALLAEIVDRYLNSDFNGLFISAGDERGVRADDKRHLVADFQAAMERRAAERHLGLQIETSVDENPVSCSPGVVDALTRLCSGLKANYLVMPSGAGHDSQHVAAAAEMGMLFVPSARGIAHTPDEYTDIADIAYGTEVFAEALLHFAGETKRA